jgi:hypothetical protein
MLDILINLLSTSYIKLTFKINKFWISLIFYLRTYKVYFVFKVASNVKPKFHYTFSWVIYFSLLTIEELTAGCPETSARNYHYAR